MDRVLKAQRTAAGRSRWPLLLGALGPAFVASVAYVDPGNVAANLTAGARYGYLLMWVLVLANLMAMLIQYLSAKLGVVTGRTLPELLGARLRPGPRRLYWAQAEIVALATDLAEVVGGALALQLLFRVPLPVGAVIVGVVSMGILAIQDFRTQQRFELAIVALLAVIALGFLAGLAVSAPSPAAMAGGLLPRFDGPDSVLLAASMLGATVMPHAIYVHSALSRDRHRGDADGHPGAPAIRRLLRGTRVDVVIALGVAGVVNIGMLLLAASTLGGTEGTDSIEGAHAAIERALGPAVGIVFAVGLLASGLASTAVGSYAGATIMQGLLERRIPLVLRRAITLVPSVLVLALGVDPTWALVVSQAVLSFGIPFALVPLIRLSTQAAVVGEHTLRPPLVVAAWLSAALVIVLNVALLWLTAGPLLGR
ncbi:manganese transporter [Sinomonas atrocyanea]|uniref:Manganese transporter n=1 Tax=Sinomonas atrocyanea TaxID=37927 RepID=A0A127A366_9MICC|nr:manganese transporter [Sinomonas atrocyanea]GEB63660.1 divalent metal cation transporter MntH [Sinomonas atrocyanea]GGG58194.1 divalent metal cation transporter MntH [Sinomonas atrocyanea]